jgi:Protein of unknown function (DUF3631)
MSQQKELPIIDLEPLTSERINLLSEVKTFIKRFVFIQDENIYELLALWVVGTYLYQEFEYVPYLFIHSPEKQSGKTRLLEVLNLLVSNSSGILGSPTEAVLFRTAQGRTLLLDEADGWLNLSSLRSVLNAGFQRNGKVGRMEKDTNGNYKSVDFSVFGPKAIAGIGSKILGGTLSDRVYAIELVRQTSSERRERLRGARIAPQATALKARIQKWADANRSKIRERYLKEEDFPFLSGFCDRTEDISEPLAVILEVAYSDESEELGWAQVRFRSAVAATRFEEDNHGGDDHIVLTTLSMHMGEDEELRIQPSQLAEWCKNDLQLDEYQAGEILRKYGFDNKSVRIGGQPRKGYVIGRDRLAELMKRFVHNPTSVETETALRKVQ